MKIGSNDIAAVKIGSTDINKVYIGSNLVWQKQVESYLLDLFPNSEEAYSLRQLQSNGGVSYPLVLIRRNSDNAEQSFTETEIIDGTLEAFCGAGNGQVVSWYDQSGNNNHANQSTANNQPYIVISGNLVTDNGKPTLYFNSLSELVSVNNTNYGTSSRSIFITINLLEGVSTKGIISLSNLSSGAGKLWIVTPEIAARANTYTWITSTPLPKDNQSLLTNIYASSANLFDGNNMYLDGNAIVRTSGANGVIDTSVGKMYIGSNGLGSNRVLANISEIVNYKSDQSTNRTQIESNINSHYNIYWDGSQSGLLDDYPNASAAYSLRALNSAYTGAAIRVRRSSDNTEQDIKLLYDGSLDTSSLLSFVGAGDGTISVWYDQSGSGNNATQSNAANQPKVVSLGSVVSYNSESALEFNGTNNYLISGVSLGSTATHINLYKYSGGTNSVVFDGVGSSNRQVPAFPREFSGTFSIFSGLTSINNGAYDTNQHIHITSFDTNDNYYRDGLQMLTNVDSGSNTITGGVIGAAFNFSSAFNGVMQEIVIYNSNVLSDRAGIESNINSNYNIYWDGSQTGLLDDYPNAAAAYSLRALNSAYTGAAIKVRRSSDNAEQDIKLLYDGSLDTTSLLSFVGAGDGFITTWYDQSGSSNNITQLTATSQSRIVIGGALSVNPQNSLPAANVGGTNIFMETTTAIATKNLFSVGKLNGLINANYITFSTSPFSGMYYGGTGAAQIQGIGLFAVGNINSLTGEDLNTHLANFYHNGSNYLVSKDSDSSVDLGSFAQLNTINILGRNLNAPTSFNGLVQEVIIYSTGDDSNNSLIKSNINSHYTIY